MKLSITEFGSKIKGKKVVIMGLGKQGGGVDGAKFFARLGADVLVTDVKSEDELKESVNYLKDYKNIKFVLGKHREVDFETAEFVLKGPSVPWKSKFVQIALKRKIPVLTSAALFFWLSPTSKVVGITGTRGKSTTTFMVYNVLNALGKSPYLLGNIPGSETLNALFSLNKNDWVVMELSSWQLSGLHKVKISPKYAIFTTFFPDHLNFYKDMEEYLYDKAAIFLYQKPSDFLFLNKRVSNILNKYQPKSTVVFFDRSDFEGELSIPGEHNKENAAAVVKFIKTLGWDLKIALKSLEKFKGLPFRLEEVGRVGNVVFVNDTTSTTPIATIVAIRTFKRKKIFLLLGGNSKGLPYSDLLEELSNVEKIYLLKGSFTNEVRDQLMGMYPDKMVNKVFDDLEKAVMSAYFDAKTKGGIVLFSPGATSFSMFANEFERGREFNRIVKEILEGKHGKKKKKRKSIT